MAYTTNTISVLAKPFSIWNLLFYLLVFSWSNFTGLIDFFFSSIYFCLIFSMGFSSSVGRCAFLAAGFPEFSVRLGQLSTCNWAKMLGKSWKTARTRDCSIRSESEPCSQGELQAEQDYGQRDNWGRGSPLRFPQKLNETNMPAAGVAMRMCPVVRPLPG